jgi:hypothetical protein
VPAACQGYYVGSTAGHPALTNSYGSCGSGYAASEVIYWLPVNDWLDHISIEFGAAADLRLFLLSGPNSANCLAAAPPGSFLDVQDLSPGSYFIVIDGHMTGSYGFAIHCYPSSGTAATRESRAAGEDQSGAWARLREPVRLP